jgi:hypothetical protein
MVVAACSGSPASPVAIVNGSAISQEQFEQYQAVFRNPDGVVTMKPSDVLLSLVNQAITHAEAQKRGIVVTDSDVDIRLSEVNGSAILGGNTAESGGDDGVRRRMRAFLEMNAVKAAVISTVTVTDDEIMAIYVATPELNELGYEASAPVIREKLLSQRVERVWEDWLAGSRRCSNIVVPDQSLGLSSTPAPDC